MQENCGRDTLARGGCAAILIQKIVGAFLNSIFWELEGGSLCAMCVTHGLVFFFFSVWAL